MERSGALQRVLPGGGIPAGGLRRFGTASAATPAKATRNRYEFGGVTRMRTHWALLSLAILVAGCATAPPSEYVKDGQAYGVTKGTFHGRWWNYYERGESFLAGGFYQEAAADFQQALAGRSRDSWNARTYGMHFVEYFPNRELGVAYFHLGRVDDAEPLLAASLQQVDTARAHDYLDRVKKAKLAKGELTDSTAPTVESSLTDGAVLSTREVPVEIHASDDLAVSIVELNGRRLHQRGSAAEVAFADELLLEEGEHTVSIRAGDLADRESARDVTLKVDLTGPAVGILEPPPNLATDAATVRLRGAAIDANGVVSVRLGDGMLQEAPAGAPRMEFESDLPLKDGENRFVVVARDVAGNETFASVTVLKTQPQNLASFLMNLPNRLLAPLRFLNVKFQAPPRYYPELAGRARFAAETPAAEPVRIELKFPKGGGDYRKNEIKVTGRVLAATSVKALEINNQRFELASAPVVEFSKRVPIARGENTIQVRAVDAEGHEAKEAVEVTGRQLVLDSPESKMSLAVLAFGGAAEEGLRQSLRAQTESRVLEAGRFDVVERVRLAEVLQEQQLSAALGDPDRAIELHKLVPATAFLVGEVIDRGQELEIYTRVISTETGRIWAPVDAHITDKGDDAQVRLAVDALADGLRRAFPRVPGEIVKIDGANVIANIGKEDGIREGMYLYVVHEEPPVVDESTGEVLIEENVIPVGRARITQVSDKASKAEAVQREEGTNLEAGMPAVTM